MFAIEIFCLPDYFKSIAISGLASFDCDFLGAGVDELDLIDNTCLVERNSQLLGIQASCNPKLLGVATEERLAKWEAPTC